MKILVVGSGGREHALVWKLSQSKKVDKIYCAPGNAGISELAQCIDIKANDIKGLVGFAKNEGIDFTVVGPDDPLVMGIVDKFEAEGLEIFGPRKNAAVIEGSKAFSKEFMKKYNIPTASYETFDSYDAALDYAKNKTFPIVVKADGLALGKGVIICNSLDEAEKALREMFINKKFGASGEKVVIEQFMTGHEVSVLAFCDGNTAVPMVSAQDHKKAFDGDKGLNTGGMGAFSPSRYYTHDLERQCMETIFRPTIDGLNKEGRQFKGVIYFGLMLTPDGPKVVEYNARFGDPETQAVLPRLETDLLDIMLACARGTLDKLEIKWSDSAAVCVVLASGGYPEKYGTGFEIKGLEPTRDNKDILLFHSGTTLKDGKTVTAGGRVLGVCGTGENLDATISAVYSFIPEIKFENVHFRKDIGRK